MRERLLLLGIAALLAAVLGVGYAASVGNERPTHLPSLSAEEVYVAGPDGEALKCQGEPVDAWRPDPAADAGSGCAAERTRAPTGEGRPLREGCEGERDGPSRLRRRPRGGHAITGGSRGGRLGNCAHPSLHSRRDLGARVHARDPEDPGRLSLLGGLVGGPSRAGAARGRRTPGAGPPPAAGLRLAPAAARKEPPRPSRAARWWTRTPAGTHPPRSR